MTLELEQSQRRCEYKNARHLIYSGTFDSCYPELKENEFYEEIILDSEEVISPTVTKVGNKVFRYSKIMVEKYSKLNKTVRLQLYYSTLNSTSGYLLPALLDARECNVGRQAFLFDTHLVNAYVSIDGSTPDGSIYLLYRFDGSTQMMNLENLFKNSKDYIRSIQPDKYHTIYQLKVEDYENYEIFLSSRFHKFTEEHKKKIENFFQLKNHMLKYQIIYNSKELREKKEKELDITIPTYVSLNQMVDLRNETYYTEKMKVEWNLPSEEFL